MRTFLAMLFALLTLIGVNEIKEQLRKAPLCAMTIHQSGDAG